MKRKEKGRKFDDNMSNGGSERERQKEINVPETDTSTRWLGVQ